ncbi:hypothetical protein CEE45_06665 [Candidatus Heimdallarchaeota archaeon B3_Heim]|nr:MAG: hypothetical protein CEE45_06665 [Candidatus Heimdallarchaeota archaeon B3_Heim]
MVVDKEKVNALLLEFQKLLKSYRPNNSELQLITSKISKMTQRNLLKQQKRRYTGKTPRKTEQPASSNKKWHKIKVD